MAILRIARSLIMGPPGCGKGTISARIVKDFNFKHLSSGDVLREQIRNESEIGLKAQKYIAQGALVPDNVMVALIGAKITNLHGKSWLLDGFPRTVPQAHALFKIEPVDIVINLDVPFDVIIGRISCRWIHPASGRVYNTEFNPPKVPGTDDLTGEALVQREDDKPETVMARLKAYNELTQPVLDFYREKDLLEQFKGKYSNEIWPKFTDISPRELRRCNIPNTNKAVGRFSV